MKTFTKLMTLTAVTIATAFVIACENKNKNNQANLPVYQNGIGGAEFFRSESKDTNQTLFFNLSFLSSSGVAAPYYNNLNYGSPVINYVGPVAVNGSLSVTMGQYLGGCLVPAGTYTLSTVQTGVWTNAIVQNVRIQAVGPASMILSIRNAQVSAKPYNQMGNLWTEIPQYGRIFGRIVIESANGYNCYGDILVD